MTFLRFDRLRGIRLSPVHSDVIEVEFSTSGGGSWGGEWRWAPLNEIAAIPLGSSEASGGQHTIPAPLIKRRVRVFQTDDVRTLAFSYATKLETRNGSAVLQQVRMNEPCFVHDAVDQPLAVPAAELARFYL